MAGAGGLAEVLLGGLLGFFLVVGALCLLVFGMATASDSKGFKAKIIALVFALVSVPLFYSFWAVVLSGHGTRGDPINYQDFWPLIGVLVLQTIALCAGAFAVVKNKRRRQDVASPTSPQDNDNRP